VRAGIDGPVTFRARHVVPMTGPPIEGGCVGLDHGRLVGVGRRCTAGRTVDFGDAIVLPGLVNAHTHLEFSGLERPLVADGGLPGWISHVVALRRGRTAGTDDREHAIAAGIAESAAAGVTTIGEIATAVARSAGPAAACRVRVFREALGLSDIASREVPRTVARDVARLQSSGACVGVSPHAPYSVAASLGRSVLQEARRRGIPAAMHLAESPAEAELIDHGSGPFRDLLESLGAWPDVAPQLLPAADWISLLARGPRGLVVHGTFLDDPALARLARHRRRLAAVVCPRTTQRLAGRLPPLQRFRGAGVRVAVGTDSRASNPDLSVLGECRALVDGGLAGPEEALRMATRDGAWALGFERLAGVLAAGRPADLVVLRPSRAWSDPHEAALDPTTQVVATLRAGRLVHGTLDLATAGSSRSRSR